MARKLAIVRSFSKNATSQRPKAAFRARRPHFFTCCLVIFDDSYTNEISNEHFVRDILTFSHVVLSFSTTVTQTSFPTSISCETSSLFHMLSSHFRRQLHKRDSQRAFRARHPHFFTCCLVIFDDSYTNEISNEHFVRDILTFSHVVLSFSTTVTQTRFPTSISCETSSLFHMLSCHFRRQLQKRDFKRAFRARHPHFFTCCLVIFDDSYTNEISNEHFVRDILTFSHVVFSFSATVTQRRSQTSISCETSFKNLSCQDD